MVFGVCRKTGQGTGEKDFDSSSKTEQEKRVEEAGKKAGSTAKDNKPFVDPKTGKKMGWAIKDGKPVAVEWGSVAGQKKPENKKKKKQNTGSGSTGGSNSSRSTTDLVRNTAAAAYLKGQEALLNDSRLNSAAKEAIQENIDRIKAKLGQ